MDILLKQNVIKKNKIIVDIGSRFIKLLGIHYSAKKISVTNAHKFDSSIFFRDGKLVEFRSMARAVKRMLGDRKQPELSISLPEDMVEHKIFSVKNKKMKDIGKLVEKEYSTFGKVSPLTHEIDYAYLGCREENGDSVHYLMVVAAGKSALAQLVGEFENQKLHVTSVSFPMYDLICLSELFHNDYEHLNRLMIDFGTTGTRVVAFAEGIPVYARNLGIGFQTYMEQLFTAQDTIGKQELSDLVYSVGEQTVLTSDQMRKYFAIQGQDTYYSVTSAIGDQLAKEIFRIVSLCENNNVTISKMILCGFPIHGFEKRLQASGYLAHRFNPELESITGGRDFVLEIGGARLDSTYNNALGLAIHTLL